MGDIMRELREKDEARQQKMLTLRCPQRQMLYYYYSRIFCERIIISRLCKGILNFLPLWRSCEDARRGRGRLVRNLSQRNLCDRLVRNLCDRLVRGRLVRNLCYFVKELNFVKDFITYYAETSLIREEARRMKEEAARWRKSRTEQGSTKTP